MSKPRVVAAICNVHMGLGHEGLKLISKKMGINIQTANPNDIVVFVNRARDKMKLLVTPGTVLGYVKSAKGHKLPIGAVQYLSQAFSEDGELSLDKATELYLSKKLEKAGEGTNMERMKL